MDIHVITSFVSLEDFLKKLSPGDFFDYHDPFSFGEIVQCGRRLGLKIQACGTPHYRCVVLSKEQLPAQKFLGTLTQLGAHEDLLFFLDMHPIRKLFGIKYKSKRAQVVKVPAVIVGDVDEENKIRLQATVHGFWTAEFYHSEILQLIRQGKVEVYRKFIL